MVWVLSSASKLSLLGLLLAFCMSSCSETEIQLSREDTKLADSLFLVSRNELKLQLDDSCDLLRDKFLPLWQDSIMNERLVEINMMMEKHDAENN